MRRGESEPQVGNRRTAWRWSFGTDATVVDMAANPCARQVLGKEERPSNDERQGANVYHSPRGQWEPSHRVLPKRTSSAQ
jgi:hypothetical protein